MEGGATLLASEPDAPASPSEATPTAEVLPSAPVAFDDPSGFARLHPTASSGRSETTKAATRRHHVRFDIIGGRFSNGHAWIPTPAPRGDRNIGLVPPRSTRRNAPCRAGAPSVTHGAVAGATNPPRRALSRFTLSRMSKKVALFWPGDARAKPNELALPQHPRSDGADRPRAEEARPRAVPGRRLPLEAARGDREARPDRRPDGRRLRPLVLRPAHVRRRRRQGQPAPPREQLLRTLARASSACSTRAHASRASNAPFSRAWTDAPDWTADDVFMARLDEWCSTGAHRLPEDEIAYHAPVTPPRRDASPRRSPPRSAAAASSSSCSATRRWA